MRFSPRNVALVGVFFLVLLFPFFSVAQELVREALVVNPVAIVAPLDRDVVSGSVAFVVSPPDESRGERVTIHSDDAGYSSSFSSDESWMSGWDSSSVPDGTYAFDIETCSIDCVTQTIHVDVRNGPRLEQVHSIPSGGSRGPGDESGGDVIPAVPLSLTFTPSNSGGAFTLQQGDLLFSSSGDPLTLNEGTYSGDFVFFDGVVDHISFSPFTLSSDTFGVYVSDSPVHGTFDALGVTYYPVASVGLRFGINARARVFLRPPLGDVLVYCSSVPPSNGSCSDPQVLTVSSDGFVDIHSSSAVLVWAHSLGHQSSTDSDVLSVLPSNVAGQFHFEDSAGNSFDSDSSLFLVSGSYSARFTFSSFLFSSAVFDHLRLDQNGTILHFDSFATGNNESVVVVMSHFPFDSGYLTVSPDFNASSLERCDSWNVLTQSCGSSWVHSPDTTMVLGTVAFRLHSNSIPPVLSPVLLSEEEQVQQSLWELQQVYSNRAYFVSDLSASNLSILATLFSKMELSLACDTISPPPAGVREVDDESSVVSGTVSSSDEQAPLLVDDEAVDGVADISLGVPDSTSPDLLPSSDVLSDSRRVDASDPRVTRWVDGSWDHFSNKGPGLQAENSISCDNVGLQHVFQLVDDSSNQKNLFGLGDDSPHVKQSLILTNQSDVAKTRFINVRLWSSLPVLSSDSRGLANDSAYQLVEPHLEDVNSDLLALDPDEVPISTPLVDSSIALQSRGDGVSGRYDFSDYWRAGLSPVGLVHSENGGMVIDTLISVTIPANSSLVVDPIYELSSTAGFSAMWDGNSAYDYIGSGYDSNASIQLVNIDNGSQSNDLLITSPLADTNSKTDNGVVYLIKDINTVSGLKGLSSVNNFSVAWAGAATSDFLGRTGKRPLGSGPGVQIINADGNSYANDLIITSVNADANSKTDAGAIYLIMDIDKKSGMFDLVNIDNSKARWIGSVASTFLGDTNLGGAGVQIVNMDGNTGTNDMVITSPVTDFSRTDSGSIYVILDINTVSGQRDLNQPAFFNTRFDGNSGATSELNGACENSGNCTIIANTDKNAGPNDLIIVAPQADCSATKAGCGTVTLIKDLNNGKFSRIVQLTDSTKFNAQWTGGNTANRLGTSNGWGQSVQVLDLNGDGFQNDLLITASQWDLNTKTDNGALFIVTDINSLSGSFDLNNGVAANYLSVYYGGYTNDTLGGSTTYNFFTSNYVSPRVRLFNMDSNATANDLVISCPLEDFNGVTNGGMIWLVKDVNAKRGAFDLNVPAFFSAAFQGVTAQDQIGHTLSTSSGFDLVNIDNNQGPNDLLIYGGLADINSKTDSGVIYLVKDVNAISTAQNRVYLGNTTSFNARWNAAAADKLTDTNFSGAAVQVVNADGNTYANDLLVVNPWADLNNFLDAGAVYLVRDIDKKSGMFDFNSISPTVQDHRWSGASNFSQIGDTNGSQPNVVLTNIDGGSFSNDLIIGAPKYDSPYKKNVGAVFLMQNISLGADRNQLDSNFNFTKEWRGDENEDSVGDSNFGGPSFILGNTDGNAFSNDLIISSMRQDVNNKTDNGAIFLVQDINVPSSQLGIVTFRVDNPSIDANSYLLGDPGIIFSANVTCVLGNCGAVDVNLQYCVGQIVVGSSNLPCTTFVDINSDSSSPLYLVSGTNPDSNASLNVGESYDVNYTVKVRSTAADVNIYYYRFYATGTTIFPSTPPEPAESIIIEPNNSFDLYQGYNSRIRFSGGTSGDKFGYTNQSHSAYTVVNIDNGSYSNDIVFSDSLADVNGKANAGAIYLFKNFDSNAGQFDLNNASLFSLRINGGNANDFLGDSNGNGSAFQIINSDGNAYSNDLLLIVPNADMNGKSDNGAIYLIKDIDKKSGSLDLNNIDNSSTFFSGSMANDQIGNTVNSEVGAIIADLNGDGSANDLIIGASFADRSRRDTGGVYFIYDINRFVGSKDLNLPTNFNLVITGSRLDDRLPTSNTTGARRTETAMQLVNLDNNAIANDLILTDSLSDTNSKADVGAVYVFEDFNRLTGTIDLNNAANIQWMFNGGAVTDNLGYTNSSGQGVQLVNVDANSFSNDLLMTSVNADINGKADAGAVFLFLDLYKRPGTYDLNNTDNTNVRWVGNAASDFLGDTSQSGLGVQVVNTDGNVASNDLLLIVPLSDFNGKANSGAVYLIKDINTLSGSRDLNNSSLVSKMAMWYGQTASDQVGDFESTGTNLVPSDSGNGVQLINGDNNSAANDLLITASNADVNGKVDAGAVYYISDVNKKSGQFNLSAQSSFNVVFMGGVASDLIGDTNRSGTGVFVSNLDGNANANDLFIVAPRADVNGQTNSGGVYLIKDFNRLTGLKDLSNTGTPTQRWTTFVRNTFFGDIGGGGQSVQVLNTDNGARANDLIIGASNMAVSYKTTNGAFYLVKNVDQNLGMFDLSFPGQFDRRWIGGKNGNLLGGTLLSEEGVQLFNLDNGAFSNDLIAVAMFADVNSKFDAGAIYFIQNISTSSVSDFSFTVSLPSSGCTVGQGNISGGTVCQKGFILSTDLNGSSDANQIAPEGQSSSQPFFVIDNQSTAETDFNIILDLNQSLPASLVLKASNTSSGYQGQCTNNPATGCVQLVAAPSTVSVGKAFYSTGTGDLNLFFWGDFIAASAGDVDRNVDVNATAS